MIRRKDNACNLTMTPRAEEARRLFSSHRHTTDQTPPSMSAQLSTLIDIQRELVEIESQKAKRQRPFNKKEAAEHLNISPNSLQKLIDSEVLKAGIHYLKVDTLYFFHPDFAEKMFGGHPTAVSSQNEASRSIQYLKPKAVPRHKDVINPDY